MSNLTKSSRKYSHYLCYLLTAYLLSCTSVMAANVKLATSPMADATTTAVLPNLMFVIDNSGSMSQEYTPDYMSDIQKDPDINDRQCLDSGDDDSGTVYPGPASGGTRVLDLCIIGDPPFTSSDMNTQYYNPSIRYTAGVNADGTSRGDQTDPTSVKTDSYGKHNLTQLLTSATTFNIATNYPDRVWCTTQSPTIANLTDTAVCRKNSGYLYPNATFKYGRNTTLSNNSPNQEVTDTMLTGVLKVTGAPYYYSVVPTEYCTAVDLKQCTQTSVPTGTYTFPARSRWCDSAALANCQSIRSGAFVWPRYVGVSAASAVAASGWIQISGTSKSKNFTSIKVGSTEILGATVSWGNTENDAGLAALVAARINTYASNPEYTASINAGDNTRIDIVSTAAAGASANGNVTKTGSASVTLPSGMDITGGVDGVSAMAPYTFTRTDIVSTTTSYPKALGRTDCLGATCTYTEEITNFGNWYTYYRTRMQAMKSAASLAFKAIDSSYRVGFITIANQSSNYLPIAKFDAGTGNQKALWYTKLFATTASTSTPLRSALSLVGRIYAGKKPVGTSDPVQYSCQQNFTLLTTDGYWNTDSASDVKDVSGTASVGNLDETATRPYYEGLTASSNSLADVAKYYYDTDLRTTDLSNCTGALGLDVCENNVFVSPTDNNNKQHMTTFTLGLGVDGTLLYTGDYLTATTGDYADIKNGIKNWSVPAADSETAIDDLWHAAVNGRGEYFSVKDPAQLVSGLKSALAALSSKIGAGAAAATSSLQPTAGDNFAYVASYTTAKWTGNLEQRSIDISTGVVSQNASWCAEDVIASSCVSPSSIQLDSSSGIYYCETPSSTTATCDALGGVLNGSVCKVNAATSCTGTLKSQVALNTRIIKMKNPSGSGLLDFSYDNMSVAQKAYFETSFLSSNLSQWTSLSATQKANAVGTNFVNYLRGQNDYEARASVTVDNRLFRYRQSVLGDVTESQPAYIGTPTFNYTDSGYAGFKATARAANVYVGANDGMLHAFNAVDGTERWAYVPSPVIPKMWKLADNNYSTMHTNYVNGDPIISDISVGGAWKTILVGGLNAGGRGYYALDISNPALPSLLWEFTTANDANLGYTYGDPVITKLNNGTWVVLITSGYNNGSLDSDGVTANSPAGDGIGYLYVLNAQTGVLIRKISTGAGSDATPSGLAKIAAYAEDAQKNNTATYVYGGDLLGNLWRFDINAGSKVLLATTGVTQPITVRPELGLVGSTRVVFFGTGKYLELTDLINTDQQSLYAISDPFATDATVTTLGNPNGDASMKQQTITGSGVNRSVSSPVGVDIPTDRGWYINLPELGERQNVDSKLVLGTLLVPTTVPSNTVCAPGGHGWFNYLDFKTGSGVAGANNVVSTKMNSPIVGFNVVYINGKPIVSGVESNNPTPQIIPSVKFSNTSTGFKGSRVIWRELMQ